MGQYHSLCTLEDGIWAVHFGDYSKRAVDSERRFLIEDGMPKSRTLVLTTGDTQAQIEAGVAELNRRRP